MCHVSSRAKRILSGARQGQTTVDRCWRGCGSGGPDPDRCGGAGQPDLQQQNQRSPVSFLLLAEPKTFSENCAHFSRRALLDAVNSAMTAHLSMFVLKLLNS